MRLFYIEELEHYKTYLVELEKGKATIEKYLRDIRTFHAWLGENLEVTKERVIAYKNYLKENYKVTSTNSMLVALNRYFQYLGWTECSVKGLRSQQQMFSPESRELKQQEYEKLVSTARQKKKEQLALIMETIAQPYEKSIATNMIEEFMLVCNETIAENSFWQEMPFMYRSHQEPDEDKLEKMEQFLRGFGYYLRKKDGEIHPRELQKVLQKAEETDEERIITRMVLRSMMQARYTAENGGHFGLAAKYYCHFTSPIRRYPDLEIHRMIKKMLHGELDEKASAYYRRKMPDWAKHCSKQERVAEDAERDTDALKKVEFMEDKVGQIYEGIISGVTNWGIYVELPNTIEGMVALSQMDDDYYEFDEKKMLVFGKRTKKSYRLGDKVVVSVAKVDRMMGTIDFVFEEENEDFQE